MRHRSLGWGALVLSVGVLLSGTIDSASASASAERSGPTTLAKRLANASLAGLPAGWVLLDRGEIRGGMLGALRVMVGSTEEGTSVVALVAVAVRSGNTLGSVDYVITSSSQQALRF